MKSHSFYSSFIKVPYTILIKLPLNNADQNWIVFNCICIHDSPVKCQSFQLRLWISNDGKCQQSSLHKTILWGHAKIVQLLLENGAEIDATDEVEENRTPLNLAVCFKRKEIVKILVDNGADFTTYQGLQNLSNSIRHCQ